MRRLLADPKILAYLHAEAKSGHLAAGKELSCAESGLLPRKGDGVRHTLAGGEMPPFIKFGIGGNVHFRHQPQKLSVLHDGSTVVEHRTLGDRQTDDENGVETRGLVQQERESVFCCLQQCGLQEQIRAGIAGDAQLRKHQNRRIRRGFKHLLQNLLGVMLTIRNTNRRRGGSHPQKSILCFFDRYIVQYTPFYNKSPV